MRSCGQRPESHLVRLGTGGCPSMDSAVVSAAPHSHQLSQHARSPQTVKVVILAGGLGTRLMEETELKPKPMVEIGGQPILWHILKHFASYGVREFVIALGYKGEVIKRYFRDYYALAGSMTVDLRTGEAQRHERETDDW